MKNKYFLLFFTGEFSRFFFRNFWILFPNFCDQKVTRFSSEKKFLRQEKKSEYFPKTVYKPQIHPRAPFTHTGDLTLSLHTSRPKCRVRSHLTLGGGVFFMFGVSFAQDHHSAQKKKQLILFKVSNTFEYKESSMLLVCVICF